MHRLRVFPDANVLVAAGLSPVGKYRRLLDLDTVEYVTSEHILKEVSENLQGYRIDPTSFLSFLRSKLRVTDQFVPLPIGLPLSDEEDRQALSEAIGAECEEFVTFNSRDFNPLYGRRILGVLIRHSADFAKEHLR